MELFQSVNVLGVDIDCIQRDELLTQMARWATEKGRYSILYVNANCLNLAWADPEYLHILNQANLVYTDGAGVAWASRILKGCKLQKNTGADLLGSFCELAQSAGWRLYILAGKPGVAQAAAENLKKKYPLLQIVGLSDGYFSGQSEDDVLEDIARCDPQFVLVGMGTPRQEKWIAASRDRIDGQVCWAVGALFDYVAGIEPRCPAWMNAMGLEWLFRLLVNPVGKWRRYLIGNPLFVYRVLMQRFTTYRAVSQCGK